MDFAKKLAIELRRRRKEAGLSQAELALHAGVGRRFVSEMEAGKPALQLDKVLAVLAVFGLVLQLERPNNS
jgi:HTH-type transcriptional regulator / antitoxin HipB